MVFFMLLLFGSGFYTFIESNITIMGKMNKSWHEVHPMPKNPTTEQRIAWHLDHAKHCACRPIPLKLKEEMEKRGITG